MRKSIVLCIAAVMLTMSVSVVTLAMDQPTTPTVTLKRQSTCPITGDSLGRSREHVDALGYRIRVCCAACPSKVKADPLKAVRTLLARGEAPRIIAVDKPQTKCPIMGDDINKKLFVDADGFRIYLCCSMCVREAKLDPDKAIRKIVENGETPEPRPVLNIQSKCPITGEPIDKSLYVDTKDGRRIYVSDQASLQKVKANPEKSVARVIANGEGLEQVSKPPAK